MPGYQYGKCFDLTHEFLVLFEVVFVFVIIFLAFAGRKHLKLDCSSRWIGNEHSVWMIENAITNHWQFVVLISRDREWEKEKREDGEGF